MSESSRCANHAASTPSGTTAISRLGMPNSAVISFAAFSE